MTVEELIGELYKQPHNAVVVRWNPDAQGYNNITSVKQIKTVAHDLEGKPVAWQAEYTDSWGEEGEAVVSLH